MIKKNNLWLLILSFIYIIFFSCLSKGSEKTENENTVKKIDRQTPLRLEQQDFDDRNNVLLIKAYESGDYNQSLHYLKLGANGKVLLSDGKTPVLLDIYLKYENGDDTVFDLFNYFLEKRKECFEHDIDLLYKGQTIGSYIAHFGTLDTLKKLAANKININSKKARAENTALFNVACRTEDYPGNKQTVYGPVNGKEKLERLYILLEAGADVTLRRELGNGTIFHYFNWWPIDESFEDLLDKFVERGADIYAKDNEGHSVIYSAVQPYALITNYEAYINYLLNRGLEFTEKDYYIIYMFFPKMIGDNSIEEFNERKKKWENDEEIQGKLKKLEEYLYSLLRQPVIIHRVFLKN